MRFDDYAKPQSVDEAWRLLSENEGATIIGGGAWLRLGKKRSKLAIDLWDAGLDGIEVNDGALEIGAMTTFRQLERNADVLELGCGILARAVKDIVGVRMRNIFTVGGTVSGRYGFSHLLCALVAVAAELDFHRDGRIPIDEYLEGPGVKGDILTKVIVPAGTGRGSFQAIRRSRNGFAVLVAAAAKTAKRLRVAVGARPGRATLAAVASETVAIAGAEPPDIFIPRAGDIAAQELSFGDDKQAGAEYRRAACPALVERALREVLS